MKNRIGSILLCFVLLVGIWSVLPPLSETPNTVAVSKASAASFLAASSLSGAASLAARQTLSLPQAKKLALANSSNYRKIKSKISLKEVSYKQAVKSLQLKKKNMATFRWTPLLSFKFPEKPDLADESEYVYKPTQIQNEITSLKHDLIDEVFAVYEEISNLYTSVYGYQETIAFLTEQQEGLNKTLERNRARLLIGEANQSDIDAIEKTIKTLESNLAQNMRSFESAKKKLSDRMNLDVTTRYTFINPYLDAKILREKLDELVEYTLENDQSYYEAKLATQLSLLSLDSNYNLMSKQYGGKMSYISSYIQQAKNREKLDSEAFKKSYDKFLTAIDAPWQGKKRILFIRIPKEWFKGAIDGVRYVEDEPYALYEAALEYQEAASDQEQLAKELEEQVRGDYESLVTARNAYLSLAEQVTTEKTEVDKALLLNSLGECTFEEYTEIQKQYEELQMEEAEALQLYTTLLYSFDRLTCGGITKYLKDAELSLSGAKGGLSYVVEEEEGQEGARYYIHSIVEDNAFEFGIHIPDDFETDVTHYELWCDSQQIGERTELSKKIRHLTLSLDEVERVFVRLYDDGTFVDDCEIDASVYEGELAITGNYLVKKETTERRVGSYRSANLTQTSLVEITIEPEASEQIAYYVIQNGEGKSILTEEPVLISEPFRYLNFLASELEGLVIKCYDENQDFLYDATFRTGDFGIYTEENQ